MPLKYHLQLLRLKRFFELLNFWAGEGSDETNLLRTFPNSTQKKLMGHGELL